MSEAKGTPLLGSPPDEIVLPRAPLERVLAQIRFPTLLSINEQKNLGPFQERIRSEYPFLSKGVAHSIQFGEGGPRVQSSEAVNWRFADEEGDWNWRLTLSHDFVSLETKSYESREDFLDRISRVLKATEETYHPNFATRIGIRYIDRLQGDAFDKAAQLIKPRLMGVFGDLDPEQIVRGVSELGLLTEEGNLTLRWGQLPEKSTYAPDIIDAIDTKSWVLDIDVFSDADARHEFSADQLGPLLRSFAERVYSMFRWVTTDEFLRYYGADI